jgi:hypothetical protein
MGLQPKAMFINNDLYAFTKSSNIYVFSNTHTGSKNPGKPLYLA